MAKLTVTEVLQKFMELSTKRKIFVITVSILLSLLFNKACDSCTETSTTQKYTPTFENFDESVVKISLHSQSKRDVESSLKSPKSADFASFYDTNFSIDKNDSTIRVQSHVDAQNSFGAMIRSNYLCTYKYVSGNPESSYSYVLKNIVIE